MLEEKYLPIRLADTFRLPRWLCKLSSARAGAFTVSGNFSPNQRPPLHGPGVSRTLTWFGLPCAFCMAGIYKMLVATGASAVCQNLFITSTARRTFQPTRLCVTMCYCLVFPFCITSNEDKYQALFTICLISAQQEDLSSHILSLFVCLSHPKCRL